MRHTHRSPFRGRLAAALALAALCGGLAALQGNLPPEALEAAWTSGDLGLALVETSMAVEEATDLADTGDDTVALVAEAQMTDAAVAPVALPGQLLAALRQAVSRTE